MEVQLMTWILMELILRISFNKMLKYAKPANSFQFLNSRKTINNIL